MGELGVGHSKDSGLGRKSSAPPDPASLREECLSAAEEAAQQVLNCIHPTLDSEEERRDIIDYMQRLIKSHLNCEVFPYGSVPLKTYLPDGDIDLTAINGTNADESLACDVLSLLRKEEKNVNAEFKVKDTQYIDAEVKLVKCLVRNTVIDISFNQLGGLSTLCFLEQVDRLVGRNHLVKRSIILIKAWCYYESRILGAHHGLISTYALETLVLYIFHLYHASLCGPLAVLHRFLEYYSKFDWEKYCISLKGPVCKSSLLDIVVKVPKNGWTDLMISEEFLENCVEMFSVSSRELEGKPKAFQPKHLNIIDPLKENNNLGRSVHIGNFYRIRSAFKYGARKLGQILSLPVDKVADEIYKFFSNAIARHGNENRNFIQDLALKFGDEESSTASLSSPVKLMSEENMLLRLSLNDNDGVEFESKNETASEGWYPMGVNLGHHSAFQTYDVISSSSTLRDDGPYRASCCNYSTSLSWNNYREPLCFLSKLPSVNGSLLETGNFLKCNLVDSASREYGFKSWLEGNKEHGEMNYRYQWCMDSSRADCSTNLGSSATKANNVDDMSLDYRDVDLTSMGESEAINPLADLTGDYDSHIRSLLYGQLCHGFSLSAGMHLPSSIPSWAKNKKSWDIICQSMPMWWSQVSQMTLQPFPTEQSNCRAADSAPPAYGFCSEPQKARGSGSDLPHNGFLGERHPLGMSRKKVSGCLDQFNSQGQSNGVNIDSGAKNNEHSGHGQSNGVHIASGVKSKENSSREDLPERGKSQHQRRPNAKCQSPHPVGNGDQKNGDLSGSWRIEFGSIGDLAERVISSSANHETQERSAGQSIHLKNEAEFPPLC
ncbi:uncharacterized protein LOC131006597 isoform X2 [Salvia miltiorrhiza]|uniref:uncharacterized protein LOC131006597 isoform X2 n=1 Tax=Salvia miltiorrhiza TaxID=226208 RepID=UPI0025AC2919|nr:uncharacterized protein LOC131006597 isoform X2 [Salvia miltiorrhiza]